MTTQTQSRPRTATSTSTTAPPTEAATKLSDAIDDFLGDVEKKFKNISDEILTKRTYIHTVYGERRC